MKRLCALLFTIILFATPQKAAAVSGTASFSGPAAVRAGDSFTVAFQINGKGVSGIQGIVTYDAGKLSLSGSPATAIGGDWNADYNASAGRISFTAYDSKGNTPVNAAQTVFRLTFKAAPSLGAGTQISVNTENVQISDGAADLTLPNASYSKTISPPLSANNNLSALTVSNAVISPAFSPAVTAYTANVGYDIAKLDVKASAADGAAKVNIDHPQLTAGGKTKITITVTAESGAKRTYTITVTRAQDPDYGRKNNARLSALTAGNTKISPAFDPDKTEYTAEVPFDIAKLEVSAAAENSAAKVNINSPQLTAGAKTKITVTVTAESGVKKTYTITVARAQDPDYKGSANHFLAGLSVEGFMLSPAFERSRESYIVWLPFEVESIKINAAAEDDKAAVSITGGDALLAGQDNIVKVTCTAESGEKREYIITAKRAPAHGAQAAASKAAASEKAAAGNAPVKNTGWVLFVAAGMLLGTAAGYFLNEFMRKKRDMAKRVK